MVYTRFRKMDDVFVPHVPTIKLPVAEVFVEASKRSVAAALVICLMFSSLFVSAGKQLGTLSYFTDTEVAATNSMQAGEWGEPALVEIEAFSLMLDQEDEGLVAGVEDTQPEETAPEETPVPEEVVVEEEEATEEAPIEEEAAPSETPAVEDPVSAEETPAAAPTEEVLAPEEGPAETSVSEPTSESQPQPTPEPPPAPEASVVVES